MKKVLCLVLSLCMLLALAACGGGDKPADSSRTADIAAVLEESVRKIRK